MRRHTRNSGMGPRENWMKLRGETYGLHVRPVSIHLLKCEESIRTDVQLKVKWRSVELNRMPSRVDKAKRQPLGSDFIFISLGCGWMINKKKKTNRIITPSKSVHWIYFLLHGFTITSTSRSIVISSNAAQPIFIHFTALRRVDGDGQVSTVKWERHSLVATASPTSSRQQKRHGPSSTGNTQAGTSLIANRSTTTTVLTPCARSQAQKEFDLLFLWLN